MLGHQIVAYKVTRDANTERDADEAGGALRLDPARPRVDRRRDRAAPVHLRRPAQARQRRSGHQDLLGERELWFIPIDNPDGYDYTFTSAGSRLWRKNLEDNNHDGAITNVDGVDTNRNWPEKWNYDLEGASDDPSSETYHGTGPASEPEVKGIRGLIQRIRPKFLIDYHSFAQLILYPFGWQVETPSDDTPLMAGLAGDDDNPAVKGFDPDVSAELYTTNGDITGMPIPTSTSWPTPSSSMAARGPPSVGPTARTRTTRRAASSSRTRMRTSRPSSPRTSRSRSTSPGRRGDRTGPSRIWATRQPDLVPTSSRPPTASPQKVEVDAKRSIGRVTLHWQVNDGRSFSATTSQFNGGSRYGEPGIYYHRLRGEVDRHGPGDKVRVWFTANGGRQSKSFTYKATRDTGTPVLIMSAEDYTGATRDRPPGRSTSTTTGGARTGDRLRRLQRRRQRTDRALVPGVLSHYKAVVWDTGDDIYVREAKQPGGTEPADDEPTSSSTTRSSRRGTT